jgi:glycine hydroxymethyltransferase
MKNFLDFSDREVNRIIKKELKRQKEYIILIPSENYVSVNILKAQGSIMTNKYAEGYPGARWYNGCKFMDEIENLAIERCKKIFGGEHVNVQPHSGSQANQAVYYAILEKGDRILGMSVEQGGHLTHGMKHNFSGRFYKAFFYNVDRKTGLIDYDEVLKIAKKVKPKLIITGASAYPRIIDFKKFKEIAEEVGAFLLADIAHIAGLVAAGIHPNPVPYCDFVTSTTHKTLRGPRGAFIICKKKFAKSIDKAVFPGLQGGPFMHTILAKAVCFKEASTKEFKNYQIQIVKNAKKLANTLKENGLKILTGGTDNHLMLVDLTDKNLTGKLAADILEEANIVVNKNVIPYDKMPPTLTSGIRPGTPSVTSRGMKEKEMEIIGNWITEILNSPDNSKLRKKIKKDVISLSQKFPIYNEL